MAFLLERPHIVMCVNFKCEINSCPWFPLKTSFVGQQQIWRPAGPLPIDREEAASQPPPLHLVVSPCTWWREIPTLNNCGCPCDAVMLGHVSLLSFVVAHPRRAADPSHTAA